MTPIIIVILVLITAFLFYYSYTSVGPDVSYSQELVVTSKNQTQVVTLIKACKNSGGTIATSTCCDSASSFPNLCLIGACGCSPDNSREIKVCNCQEGKCFDGKTCVSRQF